MSEPRLAAQPFDRLGEGPCWSAREGRLYWFDIKGKRLSWLSPQDGATGAFDLGVRASAAAPWGPKGLLIATEVGLAFFDTASGVLEMRQPMTLEAGFRTNDGRIDVRGRFWWSTMDDNGGERPGVIYRTDPDGFTAAMLEGIHIANSICVSPDGRTLYLADSKRQVIWACDADDPRSRRVFAHTEGQAASPDGSTVDEEGYLWNAQWGGWRVVRYAPDGSIDRVVELPVEQPTSCEFGGPDLGTLFVTSAWDDLSDGARADQPLAGCVFAFEPGVRGLSLPAFQA